MPAHLERKTSYIRELSPDDLRCFGMSIICAGRSHVYLDYRIGPLRRKDCTLIFLRNGRGFAETRHGLLEMGSGDVFGQLQDETFTWWTDPDYPMEHYWITTEGPLAANCLRALGIGTDTYVLHRAQMPVTEECLMEQLMGELRDQKMDGTWKAMSIFYAICHSVISSVTASNNVPQPTAPSVPEMAKALIDAQYTHLTSIVTIARRVGVTPEYLATAFRSRYGLSPQAYLTNVRLARAKALLVTGVSVKEVCYSVGYRDPNYFATLFRRKEGVTPSSMHQR